MINLDASLGQLSLTRYFFDSKVGKVIISLFHFVVLLILKIIVVILERQCKEGCMFGSFPKVTVIKSF